MVSKLTCAALHGIEAVPVHVEVDIGPGLPGTVFVGLPNAALRESRDRIRAAVRNARFKYPDRKVLVNLAPGDLRKEGPSFDLAIALGTLAALGKLLSKASRTSETLTSGFSSFRTRSRRCSSARSWSSRSSRST